MCVCVCVCVCVCERERERVTVCDCSVTSLSGGVGLVVGDVLGQVEEREREGMRVAPEYD